MKGADVVKILEKAGWYEVRQTGSHHIFKHDGFSKPISVPIHGKKDLAPGTLNNIMKAAGVKK